ncbi:MAG: phage/plasmid primase, P4 family [Candidatus Paceibacterota bacterium]|jgi:P4 family phage/plasmid primase-like protien
METENEQFKKNSLPTILEEALRYISIGFSPIPLGLITKNSDNKKTIEYPIKWKEFQYKQATPEQIKKWDCKNLGIVTGEVSGVLVLDADSYKKSFDSELLRSFRLPITPVQQTASGGTQYFFKLPKGLIIKNDVCIGHKESGIDIRASGGMVIVPPSNTPYGEYIWLISPFDTPLADIPQNLLELLKDDSENEYKTRKTLPDLVGLKEGEGRNNAMASFIGKLLNATPKENWDKEVWVMAQEVNLTYKPPLQNNELRSIYESITKIANENISKLSIENEKETDPESSIKNNLRKILKKNQPQGIWEISEYLINRHNIKTIGNRDNTKDIYLYKNGVYKIDYGLIKEEIVHITQDLVKSTFREEVIKMIKEKTYKDRECFIIDRNLINFKNGIYNIKSKELIVHKPEYLFLHQLPINYNPSADCPKLKEFLNQILDEESVKVIQEWFGYCLYRSYFIKKAIILLGERDTGKTTLLKILTKFLGIENISSVSLQKLSSDKFAISNLFQKQANIYDDLSFKDINDNGIFKMLTGGGSVTGERKFGDLFPFNNYAKLTFSCNKIPNIKDTNDDAYFSRWILLRFEYKSDNPDKFLFEKISTDIEMSGLLNFVLEGLYRILDTQDFNYKKTPEEIKLEMTMSASSLAQFVNDELEVVSDPNIFITKDDIYQEFINYVKKHSLPVASKEAIGKNLHRFITVNTGKKSIKNDETGKMEQVNSWLGLKFKNFKSKNNEIPSG